MVHALFFDGTSYFVDSADFSVDSDTEVVKKSNNLDYLSDLCDDLNDKI